MSSGYNHQSVYNLFYDFQTGEPIYDDVLGAPYRPAVEKILPYNYNLDGLITPPALEMEVWSLFGILQIL